MQPIDPTIDYAFKRVFSNPVLLLHFLNAVFQAEGLVLESVDVINPFNEREFKDDKLTIVDIKARDQAGRLIQIEVQLSNYTWLHARIVYTWADIYQGQIEAGENYNELMPVISIWILNHTMFPESKALHHRFQLYDPKNKVSLSDHLTIHTLELPKCLDDDKIKEELDLWAYFLVKGKEMDPSKPPPLMNTVIMRQAMAELELISRKQRSYWQYQSRVNARRELNALERDRDEAVAERDEVVTERDEVVTERDEAVAKLAETKAKAVEAVAERDEVVTERDEAVAERDEVASQLAREKAEKERFRIMLQEAGINPEV
jgi:predicted transposase/invertase (TIGR01784 family)